VKLSIVIACYNAADTLAGQLDALCRQEWSQPWEILLVDNRSTDASRAIAESYMERLADLRIIDASERQGQPFALNTGIRAARGESVALCDADDEIDHGWVAAMGDALAQHEFIACRIDTAKLNPEWLQGHDQQNDLQRIWYPPWLPHAGGGTLGFRKELFDRVGDFDDALPYLHDTDFCFRAQALGYALHFVPEAVLHMRKRGNLRAHYRQAYNYAHYNAILARRYWGAGDSEKPFRREFYREWFRLLRGPGSLRSQRARYWWVWRLGRQMGRLKGMLHHGGVPV
jgi:glycosyltransferase involved in cell wall biosynthesis